MTVTVCMNEAGAVWIENVQGDILAECFFKTVEETEDELRHMGYQRLLTIYPTAHIAAGAGMDRRAGRGYFWRRTGSAVMARRQCHSATTAPGRGLISRHAEG
jgi:hypothetical protein